MLHIDTDVSTNHRLELTRRVSLAACLLTLSCSMVQAYADDKTITWQVVDWPPINILNNGTTPVTAAQLGNGMVDREMAELIAELPGYHHSFVLANIKRVWTSMANGENRCFASAFKTPEREKLAYFQAITIIPAVTLVVRRDNKATAKLQFPSVSLKHVVENESGLTGDLETMRSYGPALDAILVNAGSRINRISTSYPGQLLHALDSGRMDFTLEYPMTVEYLQRQSQFKNQLDTIPLNDAAPLVIGYVACTRNAWGAKSIADIGLAARKSARKPSYRNAVRNWMPSALVKHLYSQMEKFYDDLTNAKEY
jgi:uncharacterized protein (TIGR02285 family)